MAEKELEIYGEIGLLPKAGIVWRRRWGDRITELVEEAAEAAGVSASELDEHAHENEAFGDVLLSAADRASRVADRDYRSALARVVATALDDARVDEAAYLLGQLVACEPLQLRVLMRLTRFWKGEGPASGENVSPEEAQYVARGVATVSWLSDHLGLEYSLVESAVQGLVSAGLVERHTSPRQSQARALDGVRLQAAPDRPTSWRPTGWGLRAIEMLFPNLTVARHVSF